MIDGTYRVLSIKLNGVFLPVGLLNSNSFSETSEMLDTTTRDNAGWKTSVPTNQSFSIDFDGLIKKTISVFQIETVLTYNDIRNLKRNRTLIEWRVESNEDIYISTGFGHITSLGDSSNIDEFVSFNANIEGYGNITETIKRIGDPIIIFIKSDNLGTSNDNQFTIVTNPSLTYDYVIQTSDGQVISSLTGDYTITFSTAGIHEIYITKDFPSFYYNNTGDKEKITELKKFGFYSNSTTQIGAFLGCNNMVITATDLGDFSNNTNFLQTWLFCSSLISFPLINTSLGVNFTSTWQGCSSLVSFSLIDMSSATIILSTWSGCSSLTGFPLINTSSGTNFQQAWNNCSSLVSFPLIDTSNGTNFATTWQLCSGLTSFPLLNTSNGTNFRQAWLGCSGLTSFPLLNVSSGTDFDRAWFGLSSLTSFPLIDTSNGTNFQQSWRNCSSLVNFPANFFNSCLAINFTECFLGTNLSQTSIDNILISINSNGTSNGVFTQGGGSNVPSATGVSAKNSLISRGWTVTTN